MLKLSKFCAYTGQKLAQLGEKIAQARWPCWPLFASLYCDLIFALHRSFCAFNEGDHVEENGFDEVTMATRNDDGYEEVTMATRG